MVAKALTDEEFNALWNRFYNGPDDTLGLLAVASLFEHAEVLAARLAACEAERDRLRNAMETFMGYSGRHWKRR